MIKNIKYFFFFVGISLSLDVNNTNIYDNSWALVVGINDYENVPDLHYAVEDALAIKNMLINDYKIEIPVMKWKDKTLMRISLNGYNTDNDVDKFLSVLKKIINN